MAVDATGSGVAHEASTKREIRQRKKGAPAFVMDE